METGTRLGDRYRLLRVIGKGSEGNVYLAIQESTQKFLAVKEIKKEGICYSPEGVQVWKRLSHPNLPQILDLIETDDTLWIMMEYVEGRTLKDWLARYGYPSVTVMYRWILDICRTLEYLHGQEPAVIFGDLKPENIMIQKEKPVLVDLGSSYVKGSRCKRTGTLLTSEAMALEDEKRDLICLGKTVEEILPGEGRLKELHLFAKKAMGIEAHSFQNIKDCMTYLKRLRRRRLLQGLLLLGAAAVLILVGREYTWHQEETWNRDIFSGFQEYLDQSLEDLEFSEEEYAAFLSMWGKVEEKEERYGDLLKESLSDYGEICYKVGMACWYFTDSWGGEGAAGEWFQKMMELPEDLQKKSASYLKLAKWKEQLKLHTVIGERDGFFLRFYDEMKKVQMKEEEMTEEPYFLLAYYKEETLFFIHYLAELQAEGLKESDLTGVMDQIRGEVKKIEDHRAGMIGQKKELQELLDVLEKQKGQLYGKDDTWDYTKEEWEEES